MDESKKLNVALLVFYILFVISVGLIVLEITNKASIDQPPSKTQIEEQLDSVYCEDFVGSDENIPTLDLWVPVMPDKTITVISKDTLRVSC